jgi:hypothetical protein
MKITYFNDTNVTKKVFRRDLNDLAGVVEPHSYITVDVPVFTGNGVFIKEWPNQVVLLAEIEQERSLLSET